MPINSLPGGIDDTGPQRSPEEIQIDIDRLQQELVERQAELEKQQAELKKPKFPIKAKFYAHGDKENNWAQAAELNLSEEASRNFAYTGLEVEFDILVDDKGGVLATHVNGVALTEPVEI
jgi:hypothetical protein